MNVDKKYLFRICLSLTTLYIGLNFISSGWFFSSYLILWVTIYFDVSYIRLYMPNFQNSLKKNVILFAFGIGGFVALILFTEYLGLHITFFKTKMMHWSVNCNPLLLGASLAMFNFARNSKLRSRTVNYISSLSLIIYIIHENLILRTYLRPALWQYIYTTFGYTHVVGWVFLLAMIIFVVTLCISVIYQKTLQSIIRKISDCIYGMLKKVYLLVEPALMKIE